MGLCHEFGAQIRAGCEHPMRAGASACSCAECGVVCRGLFDGCPDVWERGPRPVTISATRAAASNGAPVSTGARPEARGFRPPAAIGPAPADRVGDDHSGEAGAGAHADAAHDRPAGDRVGAGSRAAQSGPGDSRTNADPADGPPPGDPRREVFRWFEEAFEGVRSELQALIGSMTHQQAMLAELLDSRQAELRLALVAESLPDMVADSIRSAMDEHTAAMAKSFDRSHERFRDDVDQIRVATAETVESLNESFRRLVGTIAVHDEEAEQREAVRLGVIKGSVTRQVTPLAEALADLGARIDALADRVGSPGRSSPAAWAQPVSVPAPPATPKGLVASRTASRGAHPAVGKRLSTARMSRVDEVDDDDPPVVPQRVATSRVATSRVSPARTTTARAGNARAVTGLGSNGAASSPAAKRVSTARVAPAASSPAARRVSTARGAAATPPAAKRVATVRMARASEVADEPENEPPRVPRVLTRRRPAATAPLLDEPLEVYELEPPDDEGDVVDDDALDDDADDGDQDGADWRPPSWVSAAAARRSAAPGDIAGRRITRPTRTP